MTFVNDRGEAIEITGDFAITKQSVSFFNSKIKGDVSITFNVDNNSVNRKVLNYEGPHMLNQVAWTRQSFSRMRNGNVLDRGFIVIQSDEKMFLKCYYLTGNSNWVQVMDRLITELDYTGTTNLTDYTTLLSSSTVVSKISATSGIVFPLVDWMYGMNKGNDEYFMSPLLDISADEKKSFFDFYPCFYLHSLITEIATQTGIKITGNLLDEKLFKSIALAPFNGDMTRDYIKITTAYGTGQTDTTGSFVDYTNYVEDLDPENTFNNGTTYTALRSSKIKITIYSEITAASGAPIAIVRIVRNTTTVLEFSNLGINKTNVVEIAVAKGQTIKTRFRRSTAGLTSSVTIKFDVKFEIFTSITDGDYVLPNNFLPALKCIDVLKFVINFFGCSVYFNSYNKTLNINLIDRFKREDSEDWSDYFISLETDYTIKGAKNNYLRLVQPEDKEIRAYNKSNFKKYGEGNIETSNTLKDNIDILKTPFSPAGFGLSKNNTWVTNIPLLTLQDIDPIHYTSIVSSGGLAAYTIGPDFTLTQGQVCRIVDDTAGDIGIYIVRQTSGGDVTFYGISFSEDSTGKIYPQERIYNTIEPRFLIVNPSINYSDLSINQSGYNIYDDSFSVSAQTVTSFGVFSKQKTNEGIDALKDNLAFDNPSIDLYDYPTIKERYFKTIARIIGKPTHVGVFILPESVYQSFVFDKFIYIQTEKITGYFYVESIDNYIDSNTQVEVNLYML